MKPAQCVRFMVFIFYLGLIVPGLAAAQEKNTNILVLLSDNKDVYLDVATTITNSTIKYCRNHKLSCQSSNYDIVQDSSYDIESHNNYQLIVTLGIHAAIFARNNITDADIISALIPKNNPLIKEITQSGSQQSFLYLDQPLAHSLALIKALSSRFKNIGILVDINDKSTVSTLTSAANDLDLTLYFEPIESSEFIGTALNNLLVKIDIFLATPDTNIHNKATVSNILLSNYRKRIPLIGFSSAYVKAGALAAVYSSPENIAHQVRDGIVTYFSDEPLDAEEQMSRYFSVLFNTDVARSLGFPIKSESKLKEQMMDYIHDDS
ncbi:MAG: ABC transporter substrate binding protein [Candidatus Thiodiazotropha sp. 6PLUC5]